MQRELHRRVCTAVGLLALVACAACSTVLELEQPVLRPDGGVDSAPDARSNSAPDARECPAAPAGCTLFRCAGTAGCYYACTGQVSWGAAQSYCTQVGCLATIDGPAEQECIAAAANPTNSSPIWIGAHQPAGSPEPKDGWTSVCGTSTYTNWGSFEPNDYPSGSDCAELTSGGLWSDVSCNYDRRFVCELP